MSWSYDEAVSWLQRHVNHEALSSGRPRDDAGPSLERMRELCRLLGDPQEAAPAVHITGTNGKGSTARLVTALLGAHNLAVGTYTSPDLGLVRERIGRNLEPIDAQDFAEQAEAVAGVESLLDGPPTYFELLEAMAFRWFADVAVDAAVVEVGMGGRLDGTNVLDGTVAVVTNVALDHVEVIGPTLADIAREKAGIVKPGSTLILGETDPELRPIFEAEPAAQVWLRDRDFGCESNQLAVGGRLLDLRTPGAEYRDVYLSLHGAHQGDNAAVALAAAEAFFGRALDDEVVRGAFGAISVPGRFEIAARSPLVVLDGAHNPHGARAVAATLDDFGVAGERILVVGVMRNHDPRELLEALDVGKARMVVATAADWPRALPAEDVAAAARSLGVEVDVVPKVRAAVAHARALAAPEDLVLVTGSLYVVGEARRSS
ncbi:MAG TPA: Mur ligase family protein [Acidimicrobiales bacterium]